MHASLIVSLLAAGWLGQAAPQVQGKAVSSNLKVRIATSTYMPDGRVLTASANDWPLRLNEPLVVYAGGGKSICEPRAASLQRPEPATNGWWLEVTPVREGAGELELRVQWRQLGPSLRLDGQTFNRQKWNRGASEPGTTLTLHAGDRIVLDYLTELQQFYLRGYRVTDMPTGGFTYRADRANQANACNAVGMSLELGLEPAKSDAIVEAELWLVRPNRDGSERSDRQVLRLPVGQQASRFFFDEARLAGTNAGGDGLAKVTGELSVVAVENGRIRFNFNVMQRSGKSPADRSTGFRDLDAALGEVVAFKLMPENPRTDPPLSIRLRANLLR